MLAAAPDRLSEEQVEAFHRDGFVIVEAGFVPDRAVEVLRERFERVFAGAATCRSTSRSSPSSGTRPGAAAPGWRSCPPLVDRHGAKA